MQRDPKNGYEHEHGRYSQEQLLKMVSIVSSVPVELLKYLPIDVTNQIASLAQKAILLQFPTPNVAQDIRKTPVCIESGEQKYHFQPHYSYAKLKHVRVMEDWFHQNGLNMFDRPDYVLALLMMQEGEILDLSLLSDKVKRMWTIDMGTIYHPLFFFYKTRNELLEHHKTLFKGAEKKGKQPKKGYKAKVYEHWGWHHIANRLCEENRLGSTLAELDEMPMGQIMKQLSYMHDMNQVAIADAEKAALTRK